MKDETYVFYEDVKEKAVTARSSRAKPNRSVGKGWNYTQKELDAMAGEVQTYRLNRPMGYAELGRLPRDIQRQYLQNIVDTYRVNASAVGRMLGYTGRGSVHTLFKRLGVRQAENASRENERRFLKEFCKTAPETAKLDINQPVTAAPAVTSLRLCLEGGFSVKAVADTLKPMILEGQNCKIIVKVALLE